jgi:hypothetical protein
MDQGGLPKWEPRYKVVVFKRVLLDSIKTFKEAQSIATNSVEIEYPLSIKFTVSRGIAHGYPLANISLYNLSEATRAFIFHDYWDNETYHRIQLFAGYGNDSTLIFDGRIKTAYSAHENTEVVTHIEAIEFDGDQAVSLSFPKNSLLLDIIKNVCGKYLRFFVPALIVVPNEIFERGLNLTGSVARIIHRLADGMDIFSLNKLYIVPHDAVIERRNLVLTSSTGLLSTPKRYDQFLEAQTIFEPGILLGQGIKIESSIEPLWNGYYKILGIKHDAIISPNQAAQCITNLQMRNADENKKIMENA